MIVGLFVLGLFSLAAAQNPPNNVTTETLAERCVTQSGPSSRPLPLSTNTRTPALTTRVTSNITTTPVVTITPSFQTVTNVVNVTLTDTATAQLESSTNVVTITNTQSLTTSIVVTATNVTTTFYTVYESSTTSNTIAPSSGFVPIQSGITRQDGIPGKRDEIRPRARKPAAQMVVQDDGTLAVTPRQYPVRVQCLRVLYVTITRFRVLTESASTVTASTPVTTVTVTSTIRANATELQAGTTQIVTETAVATISSTATVVQSLTVTSITTSVIFSSFPTPYYAACGPDNIARSVSGVPIGVLGVKNTFGTLAANTPYDCCVRGIQGDYAGNFFQKGGCFLISQAVPAVCNPDEQAWTFTTSAVLDAEDAIVVSNGNCGQGQYLPPPPRPQNL